MPLRTLTAKYRNRAAHTDELGKADYAAWRDHVIGRDGALWKLVVPTDPRPYNHPLPIPLVLYWRLG
jgi:hypothetical protein